VKKFEERKILGKVILKRRELEKRKEMRRKKNTLNAFGNFLIVGR